MNTSLTPEQIHAFQENGFLAVHDFLSPAELHELRDAVDSAVASLGKSKVAGGELDWQDNDDSYYSKVFTQRLNLWRINETV